MIVLVLSDAFLQNNWCRFETHVALTQIVEHERNSIILVQLSTLRGQPTSDVNYLIQSRTTLPWHQSSHKQSQFWMRLKQELVVYRYQWLSIKVVRGDINSGILSVPLSFLSLMSLVDYNEPNF